MFRTGSINQGSVCYLPGVIVPAALAIVAACSLPGSGGHQRSGKSADAAALCAHWAATPFTSVLFSASPQVTKPAAVVARFSVAPLPAVGAAVEVARHREVRVARIGSRHGP